MKPAQAQEIFKIPRQTLVWLLAGLACVIIPHILRLPLWLLAIIGMSFVARILIFQGRISYPGKWLKTLFVLLTLLGVMAQFRRDIFSIDAMVGILIVGTAMKLMEMQQKKDVLLVIYLCYFTLISEFIYSQSIPVALYMMFAVMVISSALMSLNQSREYQNPARTFKTSAIILLQSLPLMLALFLLFPRISPLWAVPMQTSSGRTGLSDSMSPGDIGQLIGSPEVVFRVKFDGQPPANSELYWRGITLENFDGRRWRMGFSARPQFLGPDPNRTWDWYEEMEYLDRPLNYNVILEPSQQNWVFTLKLPRISDDRLFMRSDYQVNSRRLIGQRFSYDVQSWLTHRDEQSLDAVEMRRATSLPMEGNENSREFAMNLYQQSSSAADYVQKVLEHFNQNEFFYTLTPELLGENSIDDFMFDSREGFCEHYAAAFTYLMRAAGVPARVVTGYQGGELNPYDRTLTVRQYDAHAWSEVWLPEQGWTRVDPTAAVAPQRINNGSQLTFEQDESFLQDAGFSMLRFRNNLLLNELRYRLEMLDYNWNRFILNYDQELQLELFERMFGVVTRQKIFIFMSVVIIGIMGIMSFVVLRKSSRQKLDAASQAFLDLCGRLAARGYPRHAGETITEYCYRLAQQNPAWQASLRSIAKCLNRILYEQDYDKAEKSREAKVLKKQIRLFKRQIEST